jgi:hypothetical protein
MAMGRYPFFHHYIHEPYTLCPRIDRDYWPSLRTRSHSMTVRVFLLHLAHGVYRTEKLYSDEAAVEGWNRDVNLSRSSTSTTRGTTEGQQER